MAKNEKKEPTLVPEDEEETPEEARQRQEASFSFYLHSSLFLFFLLVFTFALFLHANKYPMILNNEIQPEVLFACFGFFVFSFLSLFLLSFWRFLAKVFISVIAGGAAAYILGLLLPYNVGNYFAHYFSFLPHDVLMYAAQNGNQIAAIAAGVVLLLILCLFRSGSMAFMSLPLLAGLFWVMNDSAKQTIPDVARSAAAAVPAADGEKTENLIHLILSGHTGYAAAAEDWQRLNAKASSPKDAAFNPAFIPAFYKSNGFTFYPSAYLRHANKYRNIANILNPSATEDTSNLFTRNDAVYYSVSDEAPAVATRNDLFKTLKNQGYALNVYQTYPFDFCKGDGAGSVDSCLTYPAPIGALYRTNLSTGTRLMLLAGHWLHSTPFGKDVLKYAYKKVAKKTNPDFFPFLGNPLSQSLPVGQPAVLSRLRRDVLAAKGKNAFFVHLDLPHYPYVYDQDCRLKTDPMKWRSNASYTDRNAFDGELRRWEDYNRQLFCTYAQINYLIKDLDDAKKLDDTTIVIHGDKGADIRKEARDEEDTTRVDKAINRFKNNMTTVFAIRKPAGKSEVRTEPCDVPTLLSRYIEGNKNAACQNPDLSSYSQEERDKTMAWLALPVTNGYLDGGNYAPLYADWLEKGGQAFMAALDERLKAEEQTPAETRKISFVAPPKQTETPVLFDEPAKEPTTDFVPVPQETVPEQPVQAEAAAEAETGLPPDTTAKEEEVKQTVDVIADELSEAPAPIVLPQIDPAVEDKWKSTDIKEGQKTTLELVPQELSDQPPQQSEQQPQTPEPPAPESAPAAEVDLIPLPALDIPDQPATEQPAPTTTVELPAPAAAVELPAPETAVPAAPTEVPTETPAEIPEETKAEAPAATSPAETVVPETNAAAEQIAVPESPAPSVAESPVPETVVVTDAVFVAKTPADTVTPPQPENAPEASEAVKTAAEQTEAEAKALAEKQAAEKAAAEAEAKALAEQQAKEKAEAEAEAEAKAKAEAKALAEKQAAEKAAAEKAKAEAEALAEKQAKEKAEAEAKAKALAEKQAAEKAAEEQAAKQRAEEEAKEREALRKPLPATIDVDKLDIIKETVTERVNDDGEVETFIFIERKPNPNRFKKKHVEERVLQQDLEHTPALPEKPEVLEHETESAPPVGNTETPASETSGQPVVSAPATPDVPAAPVAPAASDIPPAPNVPVAPNVPAAPVERVLED